MVPASRKRVASADVIGERAAKRTRSPCPLIASLVSSLPVVDVAEQGRRSEERTSTRSWPGSVTARDLPPGTALPAVDAVEQAGRSEEQTGACAPHDLQSADVLPVALVGESRAGGRGDPQVGQEPVGMTLPPAEVRERGSQSGSGPRRTGPSMSGYAFRVVPLASRYVFLHFL